MNSLLTAVLDSTNHVIWSVDLDYRLLTCNKAAARSFSRHALAALREGMLPEEFLHPPAAAELRSLYSRALAQGSFTTELTNGDQLLKLQLNPMHQQGAPVGIAAFGCDVSHINHPTAITLSESEEAAAHLRNIASHIPGIVFQFHAEDNGKLYVKYISDRCRDIAGIEPEPLDTCFARLIARVHPDDRDRCLASIHNAVSHQSRWECEGRFIRPSGEELAFRGMSEPHRRAGVTIYGGILLDISSQRRAEERCREIIEHATEGIYRTTPEGLLIAVNPAFRRITGYREHEPLPSMEQLYANPNDRRRIMQILETEGSITGMEIQFKRKDGSLGWLSANARRVAGPGGQTAFYDGFFSDISERKRQEECRIKAEDQLRQAQKLESIGRLAGGIAHDFNNLLTVINGYSSLMLCQLEEGTTLRAQAEAISQAGERAATLTQQLLTFARKKVTAHRPTEINAEIAGLLPLLRHLVGESIAIDASLAPDTQYILADPYQIQQVIVNLIVNARDAMPAGGAIRILSETRRLRPPSSPRAHHRNVVVITVSDNGCGMDEATRQRIFEPFFTTRGSARGTGLGLSIVYGIVHQSHGWIEVESEVGAGATFRLFLPKLDGPISTTSPHNPTQAEGGRETIFVVEDQSSVLNFAKSVLESYGYHVIHSTAAEAALLHARDYPGPIHLLLTDVVLPGLTGIRLAEQLKSSRPHLKVLFMSGYSPDVLGLSEVLDAGHPFLSKPFDPIQLAAKVRTVLGPQETA